MYREDQDGATLNDLDSFRPHHSPRTDSWRIRLSWLASGFMFRLKLGERQAFRIDDAQPRPGVQNQHAARQTF
jgi:hypothetical protein